MNLKNLFKPKVKPMSGVLEDIRPPEEKQKDFLTEEVLSMAAPLNWVSWDVWKTDPNHIKMLADIEVNNQKNVGSCGAESSSLALAINNYIEDKTFLKFSSKPIYARRRNKPQAGMFANDMGNICREYGTIPEKLYPSPNDTETGMSYLDGYLTAYESMAKVLRVKNYFWLYETTNIDSFAQILALGKPVVMTVIFGDGEFETIAPEVKAVPVRYGHAICALPNAYFTYGGKKAILIQNSWGDFRYYGGRQILTSDWFLKNRVVCGLFFEDLNNLSVFNEQTEKPKYQWTRDLFVGCIGEDVRQLQLALATIKDSEGFLFPLATQNATNYFGGISRQAVCRFQTLYKSEILTPLGLTTATGYVGQSTIKKLNELFK